MNLEVTNGLLSRFFFSGVSKKLELRVNLGRDGQFVRYDIFVVLAGQKPPTQTPASGTKVW